MQKQNKLFVGNLSYNASEDDLRKLFSKCGVVTEVSIPVNRDTGRKRGFAFILFETQESAQNALKELNNFEFLGRKIVVSMATNEKRTGTGGAGAGAAGRGGRGGWN
jgi:cold-inducible RNA-binding protein